MQQGSDGWHSWRGKGLGSSDASVIMGIDPYRTKEDLFLDKTGRGKPIEVNPAMLLGQKFEGGARAILYFEHNLEFEPYTCSHPKHAFIRSSLDGINEDKTLICEIKYMGAKNFEKVKASQSPLEHHYPQLQHQLLTTDIDRVLYVPYTLSPDKNRIDQLTIVPVNKDPVYINEELLPALLNFWGEVKKWTEANQSKKP